MPRVDKKDLLFDGRTKKLYRSEKTDLLMQEFKDQVETKEGQRSRIAERGSINNEISSYLFEYLEGFHLPTHFIRKVSPTEMAVKNSEPIALEFLVRNCVSAQFAKRFGMREGQDLPTPVIELYYVQDELHRPMLNEFHVYVLSIASPDELRIMNRIASKANAVLRSLFERRGLKLVEFTLRFARYKGQLIISDEITPETFRVWNYEHHKLDKERFRISGSDGREVYEELRNRIIKGVFAE